jgi:ATP-binding cassette, subfamily B, bacterial
MKLQQVMKRLLQFTPGLYLITAVFQCLRTAIQFAPGLLMQRLFDKLTQEAQLSWGLWGLVALLASVAVARLMILLTAVALQETGTHYSSAVLRKNVLETLLNRPGAEKLLYPPGDVISRLSRDAEQIGRYLSFTLLILSDLVAFLAAIMVLLAVSPSLTLLVFFPLIAASAIVYGASAYIEQYRRRSRTAEANLSTFLSDIFGLVQAIQLVNAEAQTVNYLGGLNAVRRQAALRERLFEEVILRSFINNIAQFSTGLILLLVGQSMAAGTFTVGDFALFAYFLPILSDCVFTYGQNLAVYKQAGVALERLIPLLSEAPPATLVKPGPVYMRGPLPAISYNPKTKAHALFKLEATGLTYRYPGTERGLEGVNLSLERGSFTVITGRVGAGKTTLLRVLLGLLPKQAGLIYWNGVLVEAPTSFFTPPYCAYTPQVPHLFSESLRDNILLGLPEGEVNLMEAIHLAVMEKDLRTLENGLETLIGPKGTRLSGGQIQRSAAARMFVRKPELLVFDDLSSALDLETEQTLWNRILDQKEVTCLAVSHRPSVLRRADHILVLKEGQVEAEGRLAEVLDLSPEMRKIWSSDPLLRAA